MTLEQFAVLIAAIGLGGTALFQAGVLRGRFDKHEEESQRRFAALEGARITREELTARLDGFEKQIEMLARKIDDLKEE